MDGAAEPRTSDVVELGVSADLPADDEIDDWAVAESTAIDAFQAISLDDDGDGAVNGTEVAVDLAEGELVRPGAPRRRQRP